MKKLKSAQKNVKIPEEKSGTRIPLYFGWEIKISLQKIKNKAHQLIGPFQSYRAMFVYLCMVALVVSTAGLLLVNNSNLALGAPAISNVSGQSVGTQGAIISWDTDSLSNSTVGYSSTSGNFSNTAASSAMVDNNASVGRHSVTLTGLTPNTTYFYQVSSRDILNSTATSNNGGGGFTFSTPTGPIISNTSVQETLNTQTTISWTTDIDSSTFIFYSTSASLASASQVGIDTPLTTKHQLTIQNLVAGTKYYFYVASGSAIDNNGGNYYSLTTTNDQLPPTISSVSVSPITDTEAVVRWITNEKSTGSIQYGKTSGSYTETNSLDSSFNLTHAATLTSLDTNTVYFFKITAIDASGNTALGEESQFTSREALYEESDVQLREQQARLQQVDSSAPALSAVKADKITGNTAAITWISSESGNSFVQYGATTSYGTVVGDWQYGLSHTVNLADLAPALTYHYRVISADAAGNTTTSPDATFTTSPSGTPSVTSLTELIAEKDRLLTELSGTVDNKSLETVLEEQYAFIQDLSKNIPAPLLGGVPEVDTTSTTAVISWSTDKDSNSLIALATGQEYQENPDDPYTQVIGDGLTFTKTHNVILTNLQPSNIYHYQIRTRTPISQETRSVDFTFETQEKPFEIASYTVDTTSADEVVFRWTTNVDSSSAVQYIPYRDNIKIVDQAKTISEENPTIIHQITIPELESGIIYDIELISQSADGTTVTKTIDAFTSSAANTPPIVTNIQTESALLQGKDVKVQTIISWTTNESSTSQVFYRKGVSSADEELPEKTALDTSYTKKHIVVITNFEPGAVYQFRVDSSDFSGKNTQSKPLTILTPQKEQTVFDVIINAAQQSFGWIKLFRK